ncbi:MAG: sigma-70 family RNA polymerase sigma factor [Bacteroidales bacterium]|nr:sigma-70 family RNA polymerase sigma factor [Bacteroidales bacterium]
MLVNYKLADGKVIQVEVSEEVAKFLQEDKQKHWKQNKQDKRNLSLEAIEEQGDQIIDESAQSPEEILLAEEQELEDAIMDGRLKEAIAQLDSRQQKIVNMYFFENMSFSQIAFGFGVSKMAMCYAMKVILKKLKEILQK